MERFTIRRKQESVTIEQDDGSEKEYFVREMTGRELETYLDSTRSNVIMRDGKVVGMKSFEGLYSNLLARTVWESEEMTVPLGEIVVWPATLQKALFEIAQRINGLNETREEDTLKND